jgi:threonine dehydratase
LNLTVYREVQPEKDLEKIFLKLGAGALIAGVTGQIR